MPQLLSWFEQHSIFHHMWVLMSKCRSCKLSGMQMELDGNGIACKCYGVQMPPCANAPASKCLVVQMLQCANAMACKCPDVQMQLQANAMVCRCHGMQMPQRANATCCRCWVMVCPLLPCFASLQTRSYYAACGVGLFGGRRFRAVCGGNEAFCP